MLANNGNGLWMIHSCHECFKITFQRKWRPPFTLLFLCFKWARRTCWHLVRSQFYSFDKWAIKREQKRKGKFWNCEKKAFITAHNFFLFFVFSTLLCVTSPFLPCYIQSRWLVIFMLHGSVISRSMFLSLAVRTYLYIHSSSVDGNELDKNFFSDKRKLLHRNFLSYPSRLDNVRSYHVRTWGTGSESEWTRRCCRQACMSRACSQITRSDSKRVLDFGEKHLRKKPRGHFLFLRAHMPYMLVHTKNGCIGRNIPFGTSFKTWKEIALQIFYFDFSL